MTIGWIILITYIVGFFITWIAATGLLARSDTYKPNTYTSPVESTLLTGFLGFVMAMMWPLVVSIFLVHRIATRKV